MESHKKYLSIKNFAFSLIEILIVLAIITLAVGTIITVIKPTSTFQKSRDAKRETELRTIEKFISSMLANDPTFNELDYVSTNTLYLSLSDTSSTCGSYLSQLPSLPSGWSYRCSATPTDITGQGWIPIPFSSNPLINAFQLPIDPLNKPPYYYTFTANSQGYELTAKRENKDEEIIVSNLTSRLTPISRGELDTWSRTYGGTNNDSAYSISPTSDGGYIVAGYTSSYGAGNGDFLIIKLDSSGNIQWSRTYGGTNNDSAYSISPTSDGGYIVAGYTSSYGAGNGDFLIIKLDSSGNLQWARTYGGTNNDSAYSISPTSDGGYIVAGYTYSYGAGSYDILILKLNSSGNLQWARTYGTSFSDIAYFISQTSDNGYIVAGYRSTVDSNILVFKINSTGDSIQWAKIIGGPYSDYATIVYQESDGNYIVGGGTGSYMQDPYDLSNGFIMKLSSVGGFVWAKYIDFGGSESGDSTSIYSLRKTSDNSYLVSGHVNRYDLGGYPNFFVAKINSSLNYDWSKVIGGDGNDGGGYVAETPEGKYVVGGFTDFLGSDDFLVAKLNSSGEVDKCSAFVKSISGAIGSFSPSVSNITLTINTPSLSSSTPSLSSFAPSLSAQKICPAQ